MEFVKLTISDTKEYHQQDASAEEMNILGSFLANDVGYSSSSFETWFHDSALKNTSGALTGLEKKDHCIVLTDVDSKRKNAAALTMTQEQFMQILTDWEEKVCKLQPQSVIIKYDLYNFLIETSDEIAIEKEDSEDDEALPLPLIPHKYPIWIKSWFSICCLIFSIYLYNISHYLKRTEEVQRAYRAFACGNYYDARRYYTELSKIMPRNKQIILYLAQSLFKSYNREDHKIALELLTKHELNKREWSELLKYMPQEYTVFFQDIEKKKK